MRGVAALDSARLGGRRPVHVFELRSRGSAGAALRLLRGAARSRRLRSGRGLRLRRTRSGTTRGLSPRSSRISRARTCGRSTRPLLCQLRPSSSCCACCTCFRWRSSRLPLRCRSCFLLYLWDVDVYEDAPMIVIAFTFSWGIVAGIAGARLYAATNVASHRLGSPERPEHAQRRLARGDPAAERRARVDGRGPARPASVQEVRATSSTASPSARAAVRRSSPPRRSRTPASFLHLGFKPAPGNAEAPGLRACSPSASQPRCSRQGSGSRRHRVVLAAVSLPGPDRGVLGPVGSPFASVPLAASRARRCGDRGALPSASG